MVRDIRDLDPGHERHGDRDVGIGQVAADRDAPEPGRDSAPTPFCASAVIVAPSTSAAWLAIPDAPRSWTTASACAAPMPMPMPSKVDRAAKVAAMAKRILLAFAGIRHGR